jgi:hypothetical protein
MLLAFAERTLSIPALRADLVWEAPENEARRVHARELKKENEDWAKVKKSLMAAALQAKTAAATKTNKEKVSLGRGRADEPDVQRNPRAQYATGTGECKSTPSEMSQVLMSRSTSAPLSQYGPHDTNPSEWTLMDEYTTASFSVLSTMILAHPSDGLQACWCGVSVYHPNPMFQWTRMTSLSWSRGGVISVNLQM